MNPRETVIKLIAQAVDPGASEQEARTFAFKAAQLIVEHKLLGEAPAGLGGFSSFLSAIPIERIMENVNVMALGASAVEILSLKAEVETLRSENERLRAARPKSKLVAEVAESLRASVAARRRRR